MEMLTLSFCRNNKSLKFFVVGNFCNSEISIRGPSANFIRYHQLFLSSAFVNNSWNLHIPLTRLHNHSLRYPVLFNTSLKHLSSNFSDITRHSFLLLPFFVQYVLRQHIYTFVIHRHSTTPTMTMKQDKAS